MTSIVIIRTRVEGFHVYKEAPEQVRFLNNLHRHIFHIALYIEVSHDNREREIFIEKQKLEERLHSEYGAICNFGEQSCEMIAKKIIGWTDGAFACEVSEDGEGGAIVYV